MPSALDDFAEHLRPGSRTLVATDKDAAALAGVERIQGDLWIERPVSLPDLRTVDGTLLLHGVEAAVQLPALERIGQQLLVGRCHLTQLDLPRLVWVGDLRLRTIGDSGTIGDSKHFWSVPGQPRISQGPAAVAPPSRCGSSVTSSRALPGPNAGSPAAPRAPRHASRPPSPAASPPRLPTADPAPTAATRPGCARSLAPREAHAAPSAPHTEGTATRAREPVSA